jgi:serine protease AprX
MIDSYHTQLKATNSLKDMVQRQADRTSYEVDLILHNVPNETSAALASSVAQAAGVNANDLEILPRKIRLTVNQNKIADLAALDSINRIEEVRLKDLYNDQARTILHVDAVTGSKPAEYQGTGQIVCVADTGFDQGISADTASAKVHPAFAGRIEQLVSVWSDTDAQDPVGHGTHVCASICGNGIYKDTSESKDVVIQGTAPSAKLMVQAMSKFSSDLGRWILKTPADVSTLFSGAYDMGIRIHSNSWGDSWDADTGQLDYEADATAIDTFICQHPDFGILVAAGNDAQKENHRTSQIGDNGAAKNCITVGATGTTRPNDGERYKPGIPALSGVTDTAIFSSRGPTKLTLDSKGQAIIGRIKPDVVAPGVAILSAASRAVVATARVRVEFGPSDDPDWMFSSGTSMSTPLVAGCVALLREALQQVGKQHPSAALIKALLINGAVNGSDPKNPVFDYQQGFGRVDVNASIAMIKQASFVDGGSKLESTAQDVPSLRVIQDSDKTWQSPALNIPSGRNRLVVTLTYPDPPGALLQNDVNLIVRADNVERHGNVGSDDGFDHTSKTYHCIEHQALTELQTTSRRSSGTTYLVQ